MTIFFRELEMRYKTALLCHFITFLMNYEVKRSYNPLSLLINEIGLNSTTNSRRAYRRDDDAHVNTLEWREGSDTYVDDVEARFALAARRIRHLPALFIMDRKSLPTISPASCFNTEVSNERLTKCHSKLAIASQ